MKSTKRSRACIATLVALCLLFAQMATAAYACQQGFEGVAQLASKSPVLMSDCDSMTPSQMDAAQPNLCKAHCEAGQQSHDDKSSVDIPTPAMGMWTVAWELAAFSVPSNRTTFLALSYHRLRGSPPIYLVNQVFRL